MGLFPLGMKPARKNVLATGKGRVPVEKRLSWQARGGWVRQRPGWAGEKERAVEGSPIRR